MILTEKLIHTRITIPIVLGLVLSGCLSDSEESANALTGAPPPVSDPANSAPTISGSPPGQATVGEQYSFQPTARDSDNDTLTFTAANLPGWLSFDSADGTIEGMPMLGDVGMYSDVTIRVSDGDVSSTLGPFSIEVVADTAPPPPPPPPPPPGENNPPTISGSPLPEVTVGQEYIFQPTASDLDNDTLTFSAENVPAWASFNSTNGTLQGTPEAADVGVFSNIIISVSDGEASDSLGPFSIEVIADGGATGSVTLSWTAPTENDDGSTLTDLQGFRIYWGTEPGVYPNFEDPNNTGLTTTVGTTTYVVENLALGTYYFVATAVNSEGVESTFSTSATTTLQ